MAYSWLLVLFISFQPHLSHGQSQPSGGAGAAASPISHADIRDAILTLVGAVREQTSKLERHEQRERQLGDVLTRTLGVIDSRSRGQEKNLDNLAILMARMDDRLRKMEEMIMQRDERERIQLQKIIDNTTGLRGRTGTSSGKGNDAEVLNQVTQLVKKSSVIEEALQNRLSVMANEVKIVGEKFETRSERMENLQLKAIENAGKSQSSDAEKLRAASANLVAAEAKWRQFLNDAQNIVNSFGMGVSRLTEQVNRSHNETSSILVGIENIEATLENLKAPTTSPQNDDQLAALFNNSLSSITQMITQVDTSVESSLKPILMGLEKKIESSQTATDKLDQNFQENWNNLERSVDAAVANVSSVIEDKIGEFEKKMVESQKLIQAQVEESGNMAETLADRVDKSYANLAKEINGLHKVEQVLLDTADGVLDTKRRLEFAVQQILLELGDSIRRQTGDLNSTLARKVDDVTFSVLANQSTALTNMTSKLETELGQVWRQIGVLYQSASQSQEMLQRVEQQTAQHVGGSLKALTSMDKRVGEVTQRVNEVDDHLNYLLGRLSLVVQEFNQVRGGLGEALDSLRSGLATVQGQQVSPSYNVDKQPNTDIPRKQLAEDEYFYSFLFCFFAHFLSSISTLN